MPTPFESEISALLRESQNPRRVAEDLVQRWRHRILSETEQTDVAQFLLAAGYYPLLFEQIGMMASEKHRLPWAQFVEVLGRSGIKPDEYEVRALVEGAESQEGGIAEFFKSPYIDILDASLAERRAAIRAAKGAEIEEKKSALKDKLQFMRANRLFDQEAQVLEEIQAMFPEEPEFAAERESFQLRWAREIISNASTEVDVDLPSDLHWKLEKLPPEQSAMKKLIVARATEIARDKPTSAYDMAIALHLMDMNAEAIEMLSLGMSSSRADWLKLELMLMARQFVSALDHAAEVEIKYAGDPDAAFAVIYARARALHGLGQDSLAVDLLRSLVKIRPNYKSAQSLLMEWSGGDA